MNDIKLVYIVFMLFYKLIKIKHIVFCILICFTNVLYSQDVITEWNSLYKRYDHFNSNMELIGYSEYDALYNRWIRKDLIYEKRKKEVEAENERKNHQEWIDNIIKLKQNHADKYNNDENYRKNIDRANYEEYLYYENLKKVQSENFEKNRRELNSYDNNLRILKFNYSFLNNYTDFVSDNMQINHLNFSLSYEKVFEEVNVSHYFDLGYHKIDGSTQNIMFKYSSGYIGYGFKWYPFTFQNYNFKPWRLAPRFLYFAPYIENHFTTSHEDYGTNEPTLNFNEFIFTRVGMMFGLQIVISKLIAFDINSKFFYPGVISFNSLTAERSYLKYAVQLNSSFNVGMGINF